MTVFSGKPKDASPKRFTYADYLTWPVEERWELIDGEAWDMTPAPSPKHQEILLELGRQLANFFLKKECMVYVAPFDVRLLKGDESDREIVNVVQPDILVICDRQKIDARGLRGSPDLAIEILSPSTAAKDRLKKRNLYERFGVKEFWIVSPDSATVMVFRPGTNHRYSKPLHFCWSDQLTTPLFPGLEIDLSLVFPNDEPNAPKPPRTTKTVRETAATFGQKQAPKREGNKKSAKSQPTNTNR